MRFVFRALYDAFMRFSQDDGWTIASHSHSDVAVPISDLRDRARGLSWFEESGR